MIDMGVYYKNLPYLEHGPFGDNSSFGDLKGTPYAMLSCL